MNKLLLYFSLPMIFAISCKEKKSPPISTEVVKTQSKTDTVFITKNTDSISNSASFIMERLPFWVIQSDKIKDLVINKNYKIENRLNPLYLEADFNGDGNLDIALPIFEIGTNKKGFAIIHGKTHEVFILGAGKIFKNALGDDQDYINIWVVNHEKINEAGAEEETGTGENGSLILENPSIEIEASEVGGGQIYWNGKEYAYFHQTC